MTEDKRKRIFAQNLNYYLNINQLQQVDVAKAIGVLPTTFNTWCKGQAIPRTGALSKLIDYFDIRLSDLMEENTTSEKKILNVPIVGEVACGLPIFAEQNIIGYTCVEKRDNVSFALYAKGDSMNAAKIDDGDLVFIRQQPTVENGEIALVLVDSDTATLKRFYDYGEIVVLRPDSKNDNHTEQAYKKSEHTISIQGKVVFVKSYVK